MLSKDCDKKRPSWDEYFMNMAQLASTRATCNRGVDLKYMPGYKGVGAVIVRDKVILATGYNGSPRGLEHCDDVGHELVDGHCIRTVHGEANALAAAAKNGVAINGATIYTTASPCYDCFKLLVNAGIKRIVCGAFYGSRYGASEKVLTLAAQAGVKFEFMKPDESLTPEANANKPEGIRKDSDNITKSKLKIKKIHPTASIPTYAREGDAGLDLYAISTIKAAKGERIKVPIGLAMEIAEGYVGLIWDRTGVSLDKGLKIIGGVVDSSYRGEIQVLLANISDEPVTIMPGDKIAQMVIQPFVRPEIEITNSLSETDRSDQMFGSSDKRAEGETGFVKVKEIIAQKKFEIKEGNESQKSRW